VFMVVYSQVCGKVVRMVSWSFINICVWKLLDYLSISQNPSQLTNLCFLAISAGGMGIITGDS